MLEEGKKAVPNIAQLRDKAGLTQRELSILVGVTENTIQNWERGRSIVEQILRLIRLCNVLDCKLEDLIIYIPDSEEKQKTPLPPSLQEVRKLLGTDQSQRKKMTQPSRKTVRINESAHKEDGDEK
ncbi:MAG: helix-turn-helix transcriptional regulator [Oscillatoria sp. SIO1A7]|nr:helix-turn-helix transcriptional regulator [Oscillatoria sp. SIO1A7]